MTTQWHKRVPASMVAEYVSKGWQVHSRDGRNVVLIWPKEGAPE